MSTDVVTLVEQFIAKLLGDHHTAAQYAADPAGTLAANGLTEHNLDGVDMRQATANACQIAGVPDHTRSALHSYTSGGGSPSGGHTPPSGGHERQSVEQVMQHLNYVTYVSYSDDHRITETLDRSTHIDQSTSVSFDHTGPVSGDITVDNHNANATGDGSVANTGHGDVTAATGDHSQAVGGSVTGSQLNTGDGAVQQTGGGHGPVNTGTLTGVQAGGNVDNTVVGDHNQTVQAGAGSGGVTNSAIGFGHGDVNNASGNLNFGGGANAAGGDAHNVSGNTVDHGSALATDGSSATGHDTTDVNIHHNPIIVDHAPHPVVLEAEHEPQLGTEHTGSSHYQAVEHVEEPLHHDAAVMPEHHG